MNNNIESGSRRRVKEVTLYDGPSKDRYQPGALRLDFNERVTPPPELVREALIRWAKEGEHQLYPPPYIEAEKIIGEYAGVKPEEVILTNGSDGGISLISRTILTKGEKVVVPEPTFGSLEDEPRKQRAEFVLPRPNYEKGENIDFPFDEVISQIRADEIIPDEKILDKEILTAIKSGEIIFRDGVAIRPGAKLVVICNPNSPTGTVVSREQEIKVIEKAAETGAAVLVDEAYFEFSNLTVMDLIGKFDNLYVSRTLSKAMGIADLRVGYIVSQKNNRDDLEKVRQPYEVNAFAVAAARTLRFPEVRKDIKSYTSEIMEVSKPMLEEFYRKNNIKFYPSAANFHLLRADKKLADFLKSKGIFIRVKENLPGMVRVSIGTKQDTEKYLNAVQEYLKTPQI